MQAKIPEKLSLTLFLIVLSITAPPVVTLALFLTMAALRTIVPILRPSTPAAKKRFPKLLGYFVLVAILMTFLNSVLIREGRILTQWFEIPLFEGGLLFGIRTSARLLLLSTALLVFFGSTEMAHLTGFLHRVGLPTQIVMSLLLTLHFLGSLPSRIERIFAAQQARGAPIRNNLFRRIPAFFSILSPLVLSSIVESIDRGMALELRGYRAETRLFFEEDEPPRFSATTIIFLVLSFLSLFLPWVPL